MLLLCSSSEMRGTREGNRTTDGSPRRRTISFISSCLRVEEEEEEEEEAEEEGWDDGLMISLAYACLYSGWSCEDSKYSLAGEVGGCSPCGWGPPWYPFSIFRD